MIGRTIGHYKILDRLGAGGMGEVWLAEDLELGRRVALKTLREDLAASPEKQTRFEREARAVAALNHPNIVTLFGVEEIDGNRFLAMEYVDGGTLDDRIGPSGLKTHEILRIGSAIASALGAAHARGIVHRDLKPGNVLFSKDGRIKVVDFGLARALGSESGVLGGVPRDISLTQEGLAVGTLHYMSPEQLQNRPVDARSDLFALGVVLYELTTGRMPFAGDSAAQVISSMLRDPPGKLDESRLPPMLVDLIDALLAKEPNGRPSSATVVQERLDAMLRLLDSETAALPSFSTSRDLRPFRPDLERPRSRWLAIGAATTIVIIGSGAWYLRAADKTPALPRVPAIVVLPLVDYSGESEYFVDGMTDGVISALSRIEQLRVISRQSAMHYKGSTKILPEIARELGADYLVEASVRRDGDEVRIDAKLFEPDPERQLWTDSFVRPTVNVLALHADLARSVAGQIHVNLSPEISEGFRTVRSVVPAAYEAYLRGSHLVEQGRDDSVRAARDYFDEAIRLDPSFAPAFAGLGRVYFLLGYLFEDPAEYAGLLEAAAAHALELDPELPEAHVLSGNLERYFRWDWPAAESSYRQALAYDPNNLRARRAFWALLASLGRLEEARTELGRARKLDPLSAGIESDFGYQAIFEGALGDAEKEFRRALELDPAYPYAHAGLWIIYETEGRDPDRRSELELWMRGVGRALIADEIQRRRDEWTYLETVRYVADQLEQRAKEERVTVGSLATILVSAGDLDRAEYWIARAYEERSPGLVWLAMDPAWDKLRRRPGVLRILEAMRLPPYSDRRSSPGD